MSVIRPTIRAIGPLCLAVALLVVVAMRSAAVGESADRTERVLADLYFSREFEGLVALPAVNVASAEVIRYSFDRCPIGFLAAYTGILITLSGAPVTSRWGTDGRVGLGVDETADSSISPARRP